jgi:tryptophan-rich sensory protein
MSGSYASFTKPSFAPPGILFPIIWTILYLLMGVSSYIVAQSDHPGKLLALRTYFIQLFFNFMWSILFFGLSNYLQIPYLIWLCFAAYLNIAIWLLNR